MMRQALVRRRAEIVRKGFLFASITVGAAMWAFTMLRVSGVELVSAPELDSVLATVAQAF